jgi:transporter family protein
MSSWLSAALAALMFFGLWGFFTKLAVNHINSKSATDSKGFSFAILTGLTYGVGCLFYFIAASKGKIMTVVTLTSLYPVITILLSYLLLKEDVNVRQCIGIMLAFVAIVLMSN